MHKIKKKPNSQNQKNNLIPEYQPTKHTSQLSKIQNK